jgi:starch phosphorylase
MNAHLSTGPARDCLPTEIDGFDSMSELALDMRCSRNHAADKVWRQLDPGRWEKTGTWGE